MLVYISLLEWCMYMLRYNCMFPAKTYKMNLYDYTVLFPEQNRGHSKSFIGIMPQHCSSTNECFAEISNSLAIFSHFSFSFPTCLRFYFSSGFSVQPIFLYGDGRQLRRLPFNCFFSRRKPKRDTQQQPQKTQTHISKHNFFFTERRGGEAN